MALADGAHAGRACLVRGARPACRVVARSLSQRPERAGVVVALARPCAAPAPARGRPAAAVHEAGPLQHKPSVWPASSSGTAATASTRGTHARPLPVPAAGASCTSSSAATAPSAPRRLAQGIDPASSAQPHEQPQQPQQQHRRCQAGSTAPGRHHSSGPQVATTTCPTPLAGAASHSSSPSPRWQRTQELVVVERGLGTVRMRPASAYVQQQQQQLHYQLGLGHWPRDDSLSSGSLDGVGLDGPAPRVFMGAAASPGAKSFMEDTHVLASLHPDEGVQAVSGPVHGQEVVPMAGVFDGHGGSATARYAAQRVPELLHSALSRSSAYGSCLSSSDCDLSMDQDPLNALASSFHHFDRWWNDARTDPKLTQHGWDESGATAVVGLIAGCSLLVGNAGDSSALLLRAGGVRRLTVEHRPDRNSEEAERVLGAGGRLVMRGPGAPLRLVGTSSQTAYKGCMITRSLGDFAWKHPQRLLLPDPHIARLPLARHDDSLVLLTSDGVTDVLSDQQILEIALAAVEEEQERSGDGAASAKAAADAVVAAALAANTQDNVTAVAMQLDWA